MKTERLTASPDKSELPGPITLLDGSMGQELINRGVTGHGLLWSAGALLDSPQTVAEVHLDYIAAGADVITTNTYSTTRVNLANAGIESRFEELNELACALAVQAGVRSGRNPLIAGSLPPFGESYRPDLVGDPSDIEPLYREQALLLAPHVDLILCETMSTISEAVAAVKGAAATGKPVWVSFTLADEGRAVLRSGQTIEDACTALQNLPVEAIMLNCCPPEMVALGMPQLRKHSNVATGGYANAFTPIPPLWDHQSDDDLPPPREDLDVERYTSLASQWLDAGASIIGGCCEIGPAHIAGLRSLIDKRSGAE